MQAPKCYYKNHGGEARDLKLEIPGTPPTVRICISLIFSLIMVGFAWGFFAVNLKKMYKNHISKWFSRKINNSKVIKDELVFLPFARQ